MERRKFFASFGRCCIGVGLCSIMAGSEGALALSEDDKTPVPTHSCEERIEFAEGWLKNFMRILEETVDEKTLSKIMEANGKACASDYLKSSGEEIKSVPFEEWVERAKKRDDGSVQIEGKTIYFKYLKNYQGLDAPEGSCLCPFVESKPEGLSGTYCHCSVGYIRELFGRIFGKEVKVELLEAVLRGGKRCKFKIELAE